MNSFILSCESTVDMPYAAMAERDIPVLFYSYTVDGQEYRDNMSTDPDGLKKFYQLIDQGKLPTTSQINEYSYLEFFDKLLQQGNVLHIAFGSGMTKSVQNALSAAEKLQAKYPNRKIEVVDSLCSSSGYGMLVDYAADMRDSGKGLEETAAEMDVLRKKIHHQFFSHQLDFYRRSGRMSGPVAMLATVLNICPIMRLDDAGKIIAYDKVRGKKNAIKVTMDEMEKHAENGALYDGKCFISNSDCMEEALATREAIEKRFPRLANKVKIYDIGTIIASHTGRGTVAVFFVGDERQPLKKG